METRTIRTDDGEGHLEVHSFSPVVAPPRPQRPVTRTPRRNPASSWFTEPW
ncbi:hypothetical protein [Arthrobacter sp. 24S4-2]|uniref:hypothetical protein n=1 Tax=Arthrobacter sp. 24S4-2 TaxID=2575374 RepID=UPI0020C811DE|nr:hypothetical protein [Arthrobacter sp. 24S4-2]